MMNRRQLLAVSSAGLALPLSLFHSRVARADSPVPERKFIFVVCAGGWDPTLVFAPLFGVAGVDVEADATTAEANGIIYVDHADRPNVRAFFESYGDRAAVVNGLESPSITHARCLKLILTGTADAAADDWASILAARSVNELVLPSVVLSGIAFSDQYASQVVRVGPSGQLGKLVDGSAITEFSDTPVNLLPISAEAKVDAFVRERVSRYVSGADAGRATRFGSAYQRSLSQATQVVEYAELIGLNELGGAVEAGVPQSWSYFQAAVDVLATGVSRCVSFDYKGLYNLGWDTHSQNVMQSRHFDELFQLLNMLMVELDSRSGATSGSLAEEVTVVVCSEMGRGPLLNANQGKDHFTFTSAMLIGSGVAGGQVVGGCGEGGYGEGIDFATGELDPAGAIPHTRDLGATLLALGDVDPSEAREGSAPITALMA